MTELTGKGLSKEFGKRVLFSDLSLDVAGGDCLGLIGPNGSGKTTLLKVLGGIISADTGTLQLRIDSKPAEPVISHVGVVAPWLRIYEEFTVAELMQHVLRLRGLNVNNNTIHEVLETMELRLRAADEIRLLSSGLRQRLLLALAVLPKPALLLLDEPSVTLDAGGRALVSRVIQQHRHEGGVVLLATNDDFEIALCSRTYSLSSTAASNM